MACTPCTGRRPVIATEAIGTGASVNGCESNDQSQHTKTKHFTWCENLSFLNALRLCVFAPLRFPSLNQLGGKKRKDAKTQGRKDSGMSIVQSRGARYIDTSFVPCARP